LKNTKDEFFEKSLNSFADVAEKMTDSVTLQIYAAKINGNKDQLEQIARSATESCQEKECYVRDYEIKEIIRSLSLVGELELAREFVTEIQNKNKTAEAMMFIAEESRSLEDFRNLEGLIRNEMTDRVEQIRSMEKLISLLCEEKIYVWAEVLAKNSEYETSNLARIAEIARKNGDLEIAIEFALSGQNVDALFEILDGIISKDIRKAREVAESMQELWWGSFYRAWAYVGIYFKSGESCDIDKAESVILDAIKNEAPKCEFDRYCELAMIVAANSINPEINEKLSKLLETSNWRNKEVLEKSIETLLSERKRHKKMESNLLNKNKA